MTRPCSWLFTLTDRISALVMTYSIDRNPYDGKLRNSTCLYPCLSTKNVQLLLSHQ